MHIRNIIYLLRNQNFENYDWIAEKMTNFKKFIYILLITFINFEIYLFL